MASAPTAVEERFSASGVPSMPATELATVISRPSSIQATPSAATFLVWKVTTVGVDARRDQGANSGLWAHDFVPLGHTAVLGFVPVAALSVCCVRAG